MTNTARAAATVAKFGAACVLSVCAAAPVRAGTIDDLLDLLKAKGDITQAEYNKLKAREQEEIKKSDEKLRATEARARAAEARARAAEARAHEAEGTPRAQSTALPLQLQSSAQVQTSTQAQGNVQTQAIGQALRASDANQAIQVPEHAHMQDTVQAQGTDQAGGNAQAPGNTQTLAEAEANTRAQTLSAADLPIPAAKAPVQYVTVLPNCVGMRVATVDICIKGDLIFFGVEQFPDKSATPALISGGLATADRTNSNSVRGGLLPSSIQLGMNTNQEGIDLGVYVGIYSGGNNIGVGAPFNANSPGSPVSSRYSGYRPPAVLRHAGYAHFRHCESRARHWFVRFRCHPQRFDNFRCRHPRWQFCARRNVARPHWDRLYLCRFHPTDHLHDAKLEWLDGVRRCFHAI